MTKTPWDDLYPRIAVSPDAIPLAGYYNLNYVDVVDEQRVVLRVPIRGSPEMDLRPLLFHALGIPLEPLADVRARKAELRSRPFTLIHCDVHRKNCIVEH